MRILSLLGSPRANGTTHSMARLIAGGLSGGGPVEEIALQEKHIRPCRGCQSCDAAPHVCPLARTDDAEAVFAAIAAADVVLCTGSLLGLKYFFASFGARIADTRTLRGLACPEDLLSRPDLCADLERWGRDWAVRLAEGRP